MMKTENEIRQMINTLEEDKNIRISKLSITAKNSKKARMLRLIALRRIYEINALNFVLENNNTCIECGASLIGSNYVFVCESCRIQL